MDLLIEGAVTLELVEDAVRRLVALDPDDPALPSHWSVLQLGPKAHLLAADLKGDDTAASAFAVAVERQLDRLAGPGTTVRVRLGEERDPSAPASPETDPSWDGMSSPSTSCVGAVFVPATPFDFWHGNTGVSPEMLSGALDWLFMNDGQLLQSVGGSQLVAATSEVLKRRLLTLTEDDHPPTATAFAMGSGIRMVHFSAKRYLVVGASCGIDRSSAFRAVEAAVVALSEFASAAAMVRTVSAAHLSQNFQTSTGVYVSDAVRHFASGLIDLGPLSVVPDELMNSQRFRSALHSLGDRATLQGNVLRLGGLEDWSSDGGEGVDLIRDSLDSIVLHPT